MGKLFHRLEFPQIKVLIFQCVVETFHGSIVVRTASSTHALLHVVLHADIGEFFRGKLGSLVAMKNQALAWEVPRDGYFQGFYGKTCCDLADV